VAYNKSYALNIILHPIKAEGQRCLPWHISRCDDSNPGWLTRFACCVHGAILKRKVHTPSAYGGITIQRSTRLPNPCSPPVGALKTHQLWRLHPVEPLTLTVLGRVSLGKKHKLWLVFYFGYAYMHINRIIMFLIFWFLLMELQYEVSSPTTFCKTI
jgi:hypothetical protein